MVYWYGMFLTAGRMLGRMKPSATSMERLEPPLGSSSGMAPVVSCGAMPTVLE